MTKSRGIRQRHVWSEAELATLRDRYPNERTSVIAAAMGRPIYSVYNKAHSLGLKKSAEFMESQESGRLQRGTCVGAEHRFKPDDTPANKGQRFIAGGRSVETQFKPGNRPHTWRPIGSERDMQGYLQRKVTDTGCTPRDWVGVHILLWIEHHGPIPAGHRVAFKDGNRRNIVIENLELVSIAEMMKRNTLHRLPRELVDLMRLRGVLNRQINKRSKP